MLGDIYGCTEQVQSQFAYSISQAFIALERAFGFKAVVRTPDGGARTKEQCIALGLSWTLSDHYELAKYAAVDIDNHRRFRNIDEDLFERILFQYGWENIQINGKPFPWEPWHFACHKDSPLQPATVNVKPLGKDDKMEPYLVRDGEATYLCVPGRAMIHIPNSFALTQVQTMLKTPKGEVANLGSLAAVHAVEKIWKQIPV